MWLKKQMSKINYNKKYCQPIIMKQKLKKKQLCGEKGYMISLNTFYKNKILVLFIISITKKHNAVLPLVEYTKK